VPCLARVPPRRAPVAAHRGRCSCSRGYNALVKAVRGTRAASRRFPRTPRPVRTGAGVTLRMSGSSGGRRGTCRHVSWCLDPIDTGALDCRTANSAHEVLPCHKQGNCRLGRGRPYRDERCVRFRLVGRGWAWKVAIPLMCLAAAGQLAFAGTAAASSYRVTSAHHVVGTIQTSTASSAPSTSQAATTTASSRSTSHCSIGPVGGIHNHGPGHDNRQDRDNGGQCRERLREHQHRGLHR
jgi:hypothetical protein